jgi:hypothetical protein
LYEIPKHKIDHSHTADLITPTGTFYGFVSSPSARDDGEFTFFVRANERFCHSCGTTCDANAAGKEGVRLDGQLPCSDQVDKEMGDQYSLQFAATAFFGSDACGALSQLNPDAE